MAVAAPVQHAPAGRKNAAPSPRTKGRTGPRGSLPFGGTIQTKLALGPPGDRFEREADSAAAHVTGGTPGAPTLSPVPVMTQRACAACQLGEDTRAGKPIQRTCACGAGAGQPCSCHKNHQDEHPELQIDRRAKPGAAASNDPIGAVDRVVRSPGRPLPDPVRRDMEQGFGRPFGQVRIHDNPRAAASAEGIGAHAYTVGNHIAFNRGQYQPDTDAGRFLLAHELAHTVQQSGTHGPQPARISQPGDRHETQANRAADAVTGGGAMPVLSPGAAPISRFDEDDAFDLAKDIVLGPVGSFVFDQGVDLATDAANAIWNAAVAIADAVGGHVYIDGTALVIDLPAIDACPEFEIALKLSDLGIPTSFDIPIAAGGFTVGAFTAIGSVSVVGDIDPGFGFRMEGCTLGPVSIRIDPLSLSASSVGFFSATTAASVTLSGALGMGLDTTGILSIPPVVLVAPSIGIAAGGTLDLLIDGHGQINGLVGTMFNTSGLLLFSRMTGTVAHGLDLAYGLFGTLSLAGQDVCTVNWPLDHITAGIANNLTVNAALSITPSGVTPVFTASATPLHVDPLADLAFAFDPQHMEDDCWLCEFLTDNTLMPGQHGYNWANAAYQTSLTRLGGPRTDIMARNPGRSSGALCRGTCGPDCAPGSCHKETDPIVCENVGDHHVWHTYWNYEECGSHLGCRDHDACYDMAYDMPIWGFGGYLVGPMFRACDLDAMCTYGFQTAVGWAGGSGPYDQDLHYADTRTVRPGCLGPCPENVAPDGEPAIQQTCLQDRELWPGVTAEQDWNRTLFDDQIYSGFVRIPYIVGVHYGVNAMASVAADASAQLGPINLQNACLIYDPATQTYSGTAELDLFANLRASASITGTLEGFLSDFLCLANWVTLRGSLTGGITAQLPTNFTVGVDLFCAGGALVVLPRASIQTCLDIGGEMSAQLDVFLLSFNVWGKTWPLFERNIQRCWGTEVTFDPFVVGSMPNFNLETGLLVLDDLLGEFFQGTAPADVDRTPARSPLPAAPRLLFPCLRGGGDDGDDDDDAPPVGCSQKATIRNALDHLPGTRLGPVWGSVRNVSIPGGGSAGVGTSMEAEFLATGFENESETDDTTQMAIYRHPGIPMIGCFLPKQGGQTRRIGDQQFVRGHLLNAKLGGPGDDVKNLFPITSNANGAHSRRVESPLKRATKEGDETGDLMYYKVTVQNPSGPTQITDSTGAGMGFYQMSATFLCEVADYQFCDDNTFRRNTPSFTPIPSQFLFHPPGGRPFDQVVDANLCRN